MSLERLKHISWIYDLNRLGQNAVEAEDTSSVYQGILQHIVDGFEADSGSLALLDHSHNFLMIVAGIDLPDGVIGKRVMPGEEVLGWVAKKNTPLLLNGDVSSDPRFQRQRERRRAPSETSAMCWPLAIGQSAIIDEQHPVGATVSINRTGNRPPFTASELETGTALINMVSLALSNIQLHIEQKRRLEELRQLNLQLAQTQSHLLQSEKLASIGQLAAGVAHEINNPIGYVYSNLGSLEKYVQDAFTMLDLYEEAENAITDTGVRAQLKAAREKLDIAFIKEDLRALMDESKDGITRVKNIVQNLKDFSHADTTCEFHHSDLHKGLDSTLNIVNNEIKYKADVVRDYEDIPDVECVPSQINQVFMNLLVNAAHAIEERGTITLRTRRQGDEVWVEISDTGRGISTENMKKIFDPFFTTKPVGQGTGLGLALSYGILQKHHGRIEVQSEAGHGTTFRVCLPINQPEHSAAI
ncbi:MAG: ATP-binding protein [Gallionella sp.]|nr:ATP-binding protein [Gallionella sp.]